MSNETSNESTVENVGGWAIVPANSGGRARYKRSKVKAREETGDIAHEIVEGLSESDAEVHGEQVVYDATYEMNEDLVPWNMEHGKKLGLGGRNVWVLLLISKCRA